MKSEILETMISHITTDTRRNKETVPIKLTKIEDKIRIGTMIPAADMVTMMTKGIVITKEITINTGTVTTEMMITIKQTDTEMETKMDTNAKAVTIDMKIETETEIRGPEEIKAMDITIVEITITMARTITTKDKIGTTLPTKQALLKRKKTNPMLIMITDTV